MDGQDPSAGTDKGLEPGDSCLRRRGSVEIQHYDIPGGKIPRESRERCHSMDLLTLGFFQKAKEPGTRQEGGMEEARIHQENPHVRNLRAADHSARALP